MKLLFIVGYLANPGAPPEGSSFGGPAGRCGAIVKTGFRPGRASITKNNDASETFAEERGPCLSAAFA
jgi:hypothetical protein